MSPDACKNIVQDDWRCFIHTLAVPSLEQDLFGPSALEPRELEFASFASGVEACSFVALQFECQPGCRDGPQCNSGGADGTGTVI